MPPSKAAKVLRKSLTGSALLAVVVLLLIWTSHSASGEPILYVTAALLLGAVIEASRMGSLATRDLFPALVIPAAWTVFVLMETVQPEARRSPPNLGFMYVVCAGLAACSPAIGHAWRIPRRPGSPRRLRVWRSRRPDGQRHHPRADRPRTSRGSLDLALAFRRTVCAAWDRHRTRRLDRPADRLAPGRSGDRGRRAASSRSSCARRSATPRATTSAPRSAGTTVPRRSAREDGRGMHQLVRRRRSGRRGVARPTG
jgi:hypothetical protein